MSSDAESHTARSNPLVATAPRRNWPYDPRMLGGNSWVPYISTWSGERTGSDGHDRIIGRSDGTGIGYADETILDRDGFGVLWTRTISRIGDGRPLFKQIHAARQRRAMERLLCQVCAQPADRNELGVLWLIPGDYHDDWHNWPEGLCNPHPPMCQPCAEVSTALCPMLRHTHVAVRAGHCPITGIVGARYETGAFRPRMVGGDVVDYLDPAARWIRASQLIRTMSSCTILNIHAGV